MKKMLAILLSLCLLLPALGITAVPSASAAGEYYLATTGYRVNISGVTDGTGSIAVNAAGTFDAIDLTAFGYPATGIIERDKLGLQIDTYLDGDSGVAGMSTLGNGQFELTSSSTCDQNEFMTQCTAVTFKYGEWKRSVIDLSNFSIVTGGAMDPKKWNYIRIYGFANVAANCEFKVKICNVRLVNLEADPPPADQDPLGDGTFEVDPPVFHEVDIPDGFNRGEKIVAGYNLKEFVEANQNITQVQQCLRNDDYAPIIQSLCDGLSVAGGGALYIPSGTYPCRTEIMMPEGVQIYGDWKNPDENPKIEGTILAVYAGKGTSGGAPFIKLGSNCLVRYLNFWYPEQGYTNSTVTPYSCTISLAGYGWAQDCTFVNSFTAVRHGPSYSNCPNAQDLYGTPLFLGLDMDYAIDIARIENINFSPKYWENSGLAGAPTSAEDKSSLENFLRYNANGMNVARIDWSYITYLNIEGYSAGMIFNSTTTGSANGQCLRLHFKDCRVGINVIGVGVTGEMVSNSVFENCDYGVWMAERDVNEPNNGILHLINCDIQANEYAVYQQQGAMVQILSSRIQSGVLGATYGWYTVMDTVFESEAPHVVLENGTVSSVFLGCTDAAGKPIVIENEGFCQVINDPTPVDVADIASYTDEEVLKQHRSVANKTLYLVNDLANDGKTDVTAALQAKLNTAKENGGGIVFLTNGRYLVNSTVTIPTGVELRSTMDNGTIASQKGAVICVTRTTELGTPTVIMEEGSGIRAIAFHYPDQGHDDNAARNKFTSYPYAIQGQGKDIYIINVNMHNVWNGVDLMTYRCDNHYVDYLGGEALNNMLKVGAGAEGGIIRNLHTNPNALFPDWEGKGYPAAFESNYYRQAQNNAVIIKVGYVKEQILYDCFHYSGFAGIQIESEASGKATVRAIGNATDYGTRSYNILDAERVDIMNAQMCVFNRQGSALKSELYHINLGPDNTGVVNAVGLLFWEQSACWMNVQGGTLNVYGINEHGSVQQFAAVAPDATLNAAALYLKHGMYMPTENADRVHIIGGYYTGEPGYTNLLGTYKGMLHRGSWWNFPTNRVKLPASSNVIFAESFGSGFNFQTMTVGNTNGTTVAVQSDRLLVTLGTGRSAGATAQLQNVVTDIPESVYTLEMRVNISNLSTDGSLMINLNTTSGDVLAPFGFNESGFVAIDCYGEETKLCDFTVDDQTNYRVQVVYDLREEGNKTYTVILMDDSKNVLAESEPMLMPEDMQSKGETIVSAYVGALDLTAEQSASSSTKIALDYLLFYSEGDTRLGDVNDDGNVDSTDARLTLQYFVDDIDADDINLQAADVNGDGNVDSTDARLILQYFVGSIKEFPTAK